jgi:hypothetical protein
MASADARNEARLAAKAALDAAYKADVAKVYANNPVADEQTKITGARAAIAAAESAGIPTVAKPETAAERVERYRLAREATQSGANPDNPKPTEDPGPGMYWANFGGVWRKYKSPTPTPTTTNKVLKFGDPGYVLQPGDPGYVAPGPNEIPERPVGTPPAFVYDPVSKTYKMPTKPTEAGNWTWDNIAGWTNTLVNPGATGMETGSDRTLAQDTFKNTLALFFGAKEMSQPWANALFKVVSSYYKSGSTIDESLNLALQDARNKPELEPFTKRFAGVFALQDRLAQGEAIDVPTIAEFFKSEATLGDKLREVGLGDLATQELLGEVLGTGKSVAAVLNLVNDVFMTIDNAPDALKKDLQVVAPGIDRTSIAKALLLGKRGADDLQKQIREVSVLSAAKSQGITIENTLAADIAARGFDYGTSLKNFGTVAMGAQPLQKLTEISTGQAVKPVTAQESLIKSTFQQDVKEQERIRLEAEKEAARFSGASGTFGSRSLASRNRANRVI